MYEGTPDLPDKDRFWSIVEQYGVTILYTAPTAIRTFMKWGAEFPARHDLSSLRLLGIGRRADQPRGVGLVPRAHRRRALPGRRHVVADRDRRHHDHPAARRDRRQAGQRDVPAARHRRRASSTTRASRSAIPGGGYLALTRPWPSMLRGIWGDPERYRDTYWSRFDGRYFAGDGAKRDDDGYFWLLGRVDDVMIVAGHRISTTEVESALVDHPAVAEAAVVGQTDDTTGQAIVAFVTLRGGVRAERRARSRSCATTSPSTSARSRSRRRSSSPRTCPRPARARSCAACCATSPRARRSATPRRSPIPTRGRRHQGAYLAGAAAED